ncbi:hypothetical protein DID75_04595 [Candidatus Marinamargulisbacteria bacterium SCGC AG-410-N11]|nr:hypothetical protein DID75_04595 [Candidatus Marinamargulisbacteria bacterium SCGC AG-410-N11]
MFDDLSPIKRPRKTVDLTSMIDVIFILLIFFMVSTTFATLGVSINQPKAITVDRVDNLSMHIYITKEGDCYVKKIKLSMASLENLVRKELSVKPDTLFVLFPDKESQTQRLLDVLDHCKLAGATRFSIAAKPKVE